MTLDSNALISLEDLTDQSINQSINFHGADISIEMPRASANGAPNPIRIRVRSSQKGQPDRRGWGRGAAKRSRIPGRISRARQVAYHLRTDFKDDNALQKVMLAMNQIARVMH